MTKKWHFSGFGKKDDGSPKLQGQFIAFSGPPKPGAQPEVFTIAIVKGNKPPRITLTKLINLDIPDEVHSLIIKEFWTSYLSNNSGGSDDAEMEGTLNFLEDQLRKGDSPAYDMLLETQLGKDLEDMFLADAEKVLAEHAPKEKLETELESLAVMFMRDLFKRLPLEFTHKEAKLGPEEQAQLAAHFMSLWPVELLEQAKPAIDALIAKKLGQK